MNKDTQQQIEQQCLEFIKEKIKSNQVIWVGFDSDYQKELTQQILTLIQNPAPKIFPDYIGPKYICEHFQITSAAENRKGAKIKQELAKINREIEAEMADNVDDNHTIFRDDPMPLHSYEYYQQSITKNCNSHLESLQKYTQDYDCVGFVLHYTDFALVFDSDDIVLSSAEKTYKISKDTAALSQLLQYKEFLDFIIFVTNNSVEIINLKNIQSQFEPNSSIYVRTRKTGHMTLYIKEKIFAPSCESLSK